MAILLLPVMISNAGIPKKKTDLCEWKGKKLYGKVRIVELNEDIKVRIVEGCEDLRVRVVEYNTGRCKDWYYVEYGEDIKVRFVDYNEDIKVRFVD